MKTARLVVGVGVLSLGVAVLCGYAVNEVVSIINDNIYPHSYSPVDEAKQTYIEHLEKGDHNE
jgi:hypothetical protein